jgi:hypothetical protein
VIEFYIFVILIHLSFFHSIILSSYWNILLFSPSRHVLADHAVEVWRDGEAGVAHTDHKDAGAG